MSDTTAARLRPVIVEFLGVEPDKIVRDAMFGDDLGADSLDMVELIMAVEDEFGIEITEVEAEPFDLFNQQPGTTVAKLIELVDAKLGKGRS